jgi:hypothetical protein
MAEAEAEGEAAEALANGLTKEDRSVTDAMKRIRTQRGSKLPALVLISVIHIYTCVVPRLSGTRE